MFPIEYPAQELLNDWRDLQRYAPAPEINIISDRKLTGMKLCEHFFPNFYDIKNVDGKSFNDCLKDTSFMNKMYEKIKKEGLKLTPKVLRSKIYTYGKIVRSTMFRPALAKIITRGANVVLDPCAGWGGRLLGTLAHRDSHYVAFEPNPETSQHLQELIDFLQIDRNRIHLFCDDALNMDNYDFPLADSILTSPPYFDLEVYHDGPKQSVATTYDYWEWVERFMQPLIRLCLYKSKPNVVSYWNTKAIKEGDIPKDIRDTHHAAGMYISKVYGVSTTARPNSLTGAARIDYTWAYEAGTTDVIELPEVSIVAKAMKSKTIRVPNAPVILEVHSMLNRNMKIMSIDDGYYHCECTDCGKTMKRGKENVRNSRGHINPHKCVVT